MSPSSRPFSSLTPPSLPQDFGGASSMPLTRVEDFVELQIAFLSMKHQKVVAEWAPFNQKRRSMSLSSLPFSEFGGASLTPSMKHQNVVVKWAPT
jgi:hypothetical protein